MNRGFARVQSPSGRRKAIMLQLSKTHAGPKSTAARNNQRRTILASSPFLSILQVVNARLNVWFPRSRRACSPGPARVPTVPIDRTLSSSRPPLKNDGPATTFPPSQAEDRPVSRLHLVSRLRPSPTVREASYLCSLGCEPGAIRLMATWTSRCAALITDGRDVGPVPLRGATIIYKRQEVGPLCRVGPLSSRSSGFVGKISGLAEG